LPTVHSVNADRNGKHSLVSSVGGKYIYIDSGKKFNTGGFIFYVLPVLKNAETVSLLLTSEVLSVTTDFLTGGTFKPCLRRRSAVATII